MTAFTRKWSSPVCIRTSTTASSGAVFTEQCEHVDRVGGLADHLEARSVGQVGQSSRKTSARQPGRTKRQLIQIRSDIATRVDFTSAAGTLA